MRTIRLSCSKVIDHARLLKLMGNCGSFIEYHFWCHKRGTSTTASYMDDLVKQEGLDDTCPYLDDVIVGGRTAEELGRKGF